MIFYLLINVAQNKNVNVRVKIGLDSALVVKTSGRTGAVPYDRIFRRVQRPAPLEPAINTLILGSNMEEREREREIKKLGNNRQRLAMIDERREREK